MQQVEAYVAENSQLLSNGLETMIDVELVRAYDAQNVSGIVSFTVPSGNLVEVHQALKDRGVICVLRGDAIRLSPHFYQAGQPVAEMLNVIESIL